MTRKCMQLLQVGLWAGVLALTAVGCSGGQADIGDEGSGGNEGDGSNGSKLSAFAGSYDGEIELWEADSGSSRIRIELDEDGNGTVRFGDRPIQSAPDHPFPDDASLLREGDSSSGRPLETALYPVREPSLDDGTLELFVEMGDLFAPFCEAQASVTPPCALTNYGYSTDSEANECFVSIPDEDDVNVETQVSCTRGKICYEMVACACDASTCEAKDYHQIHLRMTRDGGQVTGDVRFNAEPVYYEMNFD